MVCIEGFFHFGFLVQKVRGWRLGLKSLGLKYVFHQSKVELLNCAFMKISNQWSIYVMNSVFPKGTDYFFPQKKPKTDFLIMSAMHIFAMGLASCPQFGKTISWVTFLSFWLKNPTIFNIAGSMGLTNRLMFQALLFFIISCKNLCKNPFNLFFYNSTSQQPTVLFPIYQNNTWTIRCLVDETIDPATQHIILKIVGFQIHEIDRIEFYKCLYPIVVFYSCEYSQLIG